VPKSHFFYVNIDLKHTSQLKLEKEILTFGRYSMKISNWLLATVLIMAVNPLSCGDSSNEQSNAANPPVEEKKKSTEAEAKPVPPSASPTQEPAPPTQEIPGPVPPQETPQPVPSGPPLPIGQKATWADVQGIFAVKCLKCHASGGKRPLDKPTLIWKGKTRSQVLSEMTDSLNNNTMPPQDEPQLTDLEKTTVLKWVADGGPE
jgi:mono/diheme cytochrome c family protein